MTNDWVMALLKSGLPASFKDLPAIREFFHKHFTTWTPPSRRTIERTHFDPLYESMRRDILENINAAHSITLVFDSATSINGLPVVAFVLCLPERQYTGYLFLRVRIVQLIHGTHKPQHSSFINSLKFRLSIQTMLQQWSNAKRF